MSYSTLDNRHEFLDPVTSPKELMHSTEVYKINRDPKNKVPDVHVTMLYSSLLMVLEKPNFRGKLFLLLIYWMSNRPLQHPRQRLILVKRGGRVGFCFFPTEYNQTSEERTTFTFSRLRQIHWGEGVKRIMRTKGRINYACGSRKIFRCARQGHLLALPL
jgi:hypothetical protein